jgi:NAD(P)-dependent dehydrogenase (short-subunit alcohol dehydrogenase family)
MAMHGQRNITESSFTDNLIMKRSMEYVARTALVTGAARGIGLCIARRLAEEGAHVVIADINVEKGKQAAQDLRDFGLEVDFVHSDLTVPGEALVMTLEAQHLMGRIDVLINNARGGRRLGLLEETEENWDQSIDVGVKAAFFASQSTIRMMADHGGCSIVNVASVAAIQATNESPSYHASKSGLLHLTKYLAVAGGPYRARVNCVLPGLIVQDEHRARFQSAENEAYRSIAANYQPLGEVGSEQDVAEAVLYLCSERASYISGACVTIDGAATAQEPFGLMLRSS